MKDLQLVTSARYVAGYTLELTFNDGLQAGLILRLGLKNMNSSRRSRMLIISKTFRRTVGRLFGKTARTLRPKLCIKRDEG